MRRTLLALTAVLACAPPAHWPPRPASKPPTPAELAVYEVTARAADAAERETFARALAARGFKVVDHDPYRGNLELFLTHEAPQLVATLRSDGWFVDEAVGSTYEDLADTLAVSQRLADFIRNSGLPQQYPILNH